MQFQIHAPSQDFNLGAHPNGLSSLLTINGYFYRMLVLSPEGNWSTVATQHEHPQLSRVYPNISTTITLDTDSFRDLFLWQQHRTEVPKINL